MFALELHRAECEFLTGESDNRGGAPDDACLARGESLSIRAAVACLRIDLYTTLDRSDRAVEVSSRLPASSGHRVVAPSDRRGSRDANTSEPGRCSARREIEELIDLP